ncbi:MAG: Holliday junction resolvase RuvX [Actinobacteria bacterium]|nr:MAG: Holliday junction resolvase RuvX [Actinomycetota bacterium]
MRKLGIDLGSKRIGLAVSDVLNLTAQPLKYILRSNLSEDINQLKKVITEYNIDEIVVGIPVSLDGSYQASARQALDYSKNLEKELKIKVSTWDERLTTVQAENMLIKADVKREKRKQIVDKVAASIILQGYLDSRKRLKAEE